MKKKLPFGIATEARVTPTTATLVSVDDHIGKSDVVVETWWSGEGITLQITEGSKDQSIEISWSQLRAFRMCLKAMKENQPQR